MRNKEVKFSFGVVEFAANHLTLFVNDSENFTTEMLDEIIDYKTKLNPIQRLGYISVRQNSFSFDPTLFTQRKDEIIANFSKLAIVSEREADKLEYDYLQKMCPIPCQYFDSMEKAKSWLLKSKR